MRCFSKTLFTTMVVLGTGQVFAQPVIIQGGQITNPPPGANPTQQNGQILNGQPAQTVTINQQYGSQLYQNADIRRSLNLTDDQFTRLNSANDQLRQRYLEQSGRLNSLPTAERAAEIQKLQAGLRDDFYRSAAGIFTPEQLQRYRQLDYQNQGLNAFANPEVRRNLNLTDEQVRKLQEFQAQTTAQSAATNSSPAGRDSSTPYPIFREPTFGRTSAVLNPEQREAWLKMLGEPYKTPAVGTSNPGKK